MKLSKHTLPKEALKKHKATKDPLFSMSEKEIDEYLKDNDAEAIKKLILAFGAICYNKTRGQK